MPEGRWQVDDPKVAPPHKYEVSSNMEALIHHFKLYTEGYRRPAGEVYLRTESPKGELGFYMSARRRETISHARARALVRQSWRRCPR